MDSISGILLNSVQYHYNEFNVLHAVLYTDEETADHAAYASNLYCCIEEVEQGALTRGTKWTHCVRWKGASAISLAGMIHDMFPNEYRNYGAAAFMNTHGNVPSFRYVLSDPSAVHPTKGHLSDTGFDLTLVKFDGKKGSALMYNTCIQLQPCHGYYFDLVARSSLSKTGYILANSVGIIDQNYTGDVKVALIKIDKDAPDLVLPFKGVQLIPRVWCHMHPVHVNRLDDTDRGSGGFGSTSK